MNKLLQYNSLIILIVLSVLLYGVWNAINIDSAPSHDEFIKYVSEGNLEKVKQALNAGYDVVSDYKNDIYGRTALHFGITHRDMIKLLIESGVDVNRRSNLYGDLATPLSMASWVANVDAATVKLLLDAGADPTIANVDEQTPLDYAIKWEFEDKEKLIRQSMPHNSAITEKAPTPKFVHSEGIGSVGDGIAFQNGGARWNPIILVNGDPVMCASEYGIHDLSEWMVQETNVIEIIARKGEYEPDEVAWFRIWRYNKNDSSITQRLYAFEVLPEMQQQQIYRATVMVDAPVKDINSGLSDIPEKLSENDRNEIYSIINQYAQLFVDKETIGSQDFIYLRNRDKSKAELSSFNEFLHSWVYFRDYQVRTAASDCVEFIRGPNIVAAMPAGNEIYLISTSREQDDDNNSEQWQAFIKVDFLCFGRVSGQWKLLI